MIDQVNWGLLATGAIAAAFARGLKWSATGRLVAVGSRSPEAAAAFATAHGVPRCHGSYEALLADPEVQAVYVSTPHPMHLEWALKALDAGKHVLVEKPAGMNQTEAQVMIDAATARRLFLMEAYMYRCHPQTAKLVELIRDGAIGQVRVIQACFSYGAAFDPQSRAWNKALGGGGILDIGGYTTSIARLIAGAAVGAPFADPVAVTGAGHLHPETGVDAWAVGTLQFESGIVATLATGVGVTQENVVRVFGTGGSLLLPAPYVCERAGRSVGRIMLKRQGAASAEEIACDSEVTSFALEADVAGRAILAGRQQADAMSWADTLGNLRTMDQWRHAIGLHYTADECAS